MKNVKNRSAVFAGFITIIFLTALLNGNCEDVNKYEYDEVLKINLLIQKENGFISEPETAIKIAEVIWISMYGETINKFKPFQAILRDDIWYVNGTMAENTLGGIPYIKISKSDGRILGVIHTK